MMSLTLSLERHLWAAWSLILASGLSLVMGG